MINKKSNKGTVVFYFSLFLLICFLYSSVHAQYHEDNTTLYWEIGNVCVLANSQEGQHNFLMDVDIQNAGYYRIVPKVNYSSRGGQKNESFYLTIDHQDSQITPIDANAGPYKVVQDIEGDTIVFRDAGFFFFEQGKNSITMHHYASIADLYPQFLVDSLSGGPESVHIIDSVKIVAEPIFYNLEDVFKSYLFEDKDNDGSISVGDLISYTIEIENSGTGIAHNVVFTDSIPQYTEYVSGSATTTKGTIQIPPGYIKATIGTMAPLRSEKITVTFQVRVTNDAFQIENQGTIDSDETEPHPTDDPDTPEEDDKTIKRHPDFRGATDVYKRDQYRDANGDGKISAGDSIYYTITIANSGSGEATNVVFTDSIPNNTSFIEGSANTSKGTIVSTSPVLQVNVGNIAANSEETITITFGVLVTSESDEITNQGYVDSNETQPHPSDDPDTPDQNDDPTKTQSPRFTNTNDVLKSQTFHDLDDSGTLTPGDLISYTISIKNSGLGVANNAVFIDSLPTNTSYVTGSVATSKGIVVSTDPVLQVNIGDIAPSETEVITISFQVQVTTPVELIENQGYVVSDETLPHPTDDPSSPEENDKTITRSPNFKSLNDILKQDKFIDTDRNNAISAGDTISYTISITNSGNGTANNVVFTDSIPQNTLYSEGSITTTKGTIISTSPILQVNIGNIAPNSKETVVIAFKVVVTSSVEIIKNQGYLDSDETQPHPTDDPDTPEENDDTKTRLPNFQGATDVLKNDQFKDMDKNGEISAGDSIIYTITITNSGSDFATDVVFTDTIPQNTTYVEGSASSSKGTLLSTSPILQFDIGSVAPDSSETVTITFKVIATGSIEQITNQGFIISNETTPHPTDDPDTDKEDDETITRLPNFTKTSDVLKIDQFKDVDGSGNITAGDSISYTITISNSGAGFANDVVFTDTIPKNTTFVEGSASTSKGTIVSTSPILQINIGSLAPHSSETVNIYFKVIVANSASLIENQGFLQSKETLPHPTDDPHTPEEDDETITRAPNFRGQSDLLKIDYFEDTDQSNSLSVGDSITYKISITNSGTGTANNVVFLDTIPQNTSYADGSLLSSKGSVVSTSPTIQINIGTIAPDKKETVTIEFMVILTDTVSEIGNQGFLWSDETPAHPTDDPDTPTENDETKTRLPNFMKSGDVIKSDVFYDVDNSGNISTSDLISYNIKIKNSGMGVATNVVFSDSIPNHTSYVNGSVSTSKGNIISTSPVLEINIGNISPNEIITIMFQVIVNEPVEQIENQGILTSNEITPEPTDDPDTPDKNDKTITAFPSFNYPTDVLKSAEILDTDGDYTLSTGDVITYNITIQNSGLGIATNVVFTDTIPNFTIYVTGSATSSKGEITSTSPILNINIGDISPNRSEIVSITYQVTVSHDVEQIVNQGFVDSHETPTEPTDDPNTPEDDDETITDIAELQTDISVNLFAVTDSIVVGATPSDTMKYADENETYTTFIKLQNLGLVKAKDVKIINWPPDSIIISNIHPQEASCCKDSIVWSFPEIAPDSTVVLQFDVSVPAIMPFGRTELFNKVTASASNENPEKLSNNSVTETVYNDVPETPALVPGIEVNPSSIDVTDSATIKIQIPINTKSWDLWVYFPNGQIDSTFADDFIAGSSLTPDLWHDVNEMYNPVHLQTTAKQENITFEIRTIDTRARKASAQTILTVFSANYLVLDRNVFKPEFEDAIGIKFKLSSKRIAKLDVYDSSGRHITEITKDIYEGGWNIYHWDGLKSNNQKVGSGVYIVTLRSGEFNSWKKFIIVR